MNIRHSDVSLLYPEMQGPVRALAEELVLAYQADITEYRFEVFETYRSFWRQADLLAKGTTKARPGESAHQFGFAVDFVPFLSQAEAVALGVRPGWYWPKPEHGDWEILGELAAQCGLRQPITWDKSHIEFPNWQVIRKRW